MYRIESINLVSTGGECIVNKIHIPLGIMVPSAQNLVNPEIISEHWQDLQATRLALSITTRIEMSLPKNYGNYLDFLPKEFLIIQPNQPLQFPNIPLKNLKFYYLVK